MSLLQDYARSCTMMIRERSQYDNRAYACDFILGLSILGKTEDSDEGGWVTDWQDGTEFECYSALDNSQEIDRAEQEGLSRTFNVLVKQDVEIQYNDYFRDNKTGQRFRVVSNPQDRKSPASASFSLKQFTAERLGNDEVGG